MFKRKRELQREIKSLTWEKTNYEAIIQRQQQEIERLKKQLNGDQVTSECCLKCEHGLTRWARIFLHIKLQV